MACTAMIPAYSCCRERSNRTVRSICRGSARLVSEGPPRTPRGRGSRSNGKARRAKKSPSRHTCSSATPCEVSKRSRERVHGGGMGIPGGETDERAADVSGLSRREPRASRREFVRGAEGSRRAHHRRTPDAILRKARSSGSLPIGISIPSSST